MIVLCADQEARLLPTVRSRCARIRLGLRRPARHRGDRRRSRPGRSADSRPGSAGSPRGRPGLALAYARAPEAVLIRAELSARPARPDRRRRGRAPGRGPRRRSRAPSRWRARSAAETDGAGRGPALAPARRRRPRTPGCPDARGRPRRRGRTARRTTRTSGRARPSRPRNAAAPRRSCSALWADVARDLALVGAGGGRSVHDPVLLEELAAVGRQRSRPDAVSRRSSSAPPGPPSCSPPMCRPSSPRSLALAWPRRAAGRLRPSPMPHRSARPCGSTRAVTGRVQGVGFRYFVLPGGPWPWGSSGWVANAPDGSVRVRRRGPARPAGGASRSPCATARRRRIVDGVSDAWMPATGALRGVRRPERRPTAATDRACAHLGRPSPTGGRTGGLFRPGRRSDHRCARWSQKSAAEELPALYRAVLDRVAQLDASGHRDVGYRIRARGHRGSTPVPGTIARGAASRRSCARPSDTGADRKRDPVAAVRAPERPASPDAGARRGRPAARRLASCRRDDPATVHRRARSRRTPGWPSSARRSRTSGRTSTTWPMPGATRLMPGRRRARDDDPSRRGRAAAIDRAVDEIGLIEDPHRAIDWLSTFPQVVLLAARRTSVRFQDAARDARAVVYAGIQADPLVARRRRAPGRRHARASGSSPAPS